MNKSLLTSDSLIGSLCREIEYIRQRYKNVRISLNTSKDKVLIKRLNKEISCLEARRIELLEISAQFNQNANKSISKMFLHELCLRPLSLSL